jgi:hypothetical protein
MSPNLSSTRPTFSALVLWVIASSRSTCSPLLYALTVNNPKWALKMVRSQAGVSSVAASFIDGSPVPAGRRRAPNNVRNRGTSSPDRTRPAMVSNTASIA